MNNSQRGFVWWAYALAAAGSLAAIYLAYNTIDGRGYDRGKSETESTYKTRDNAALTQAIATVQRLQKERATQELAHQSRLAEINEAHQKDKADAQKIHARNLAAARAGTLKLRDPGATAYAANSDRSPAAAPAAAVTGGDAAQGRELSGTSADFLLGLTAEADEITRQLGLAQQIIVEQRRACR